METSLVSIVPSGGHLQVQWWPGASVTNAKRLLVKLGCDWLMLKHQPITAKLPAKSF